MTHLSGYYLYLKRNGICIRCHKPQNDNGICPDCDDMTDAEINEYIVNCKAGMREAKTELREYSAIATNKKCAERESWEAWFNARAVLARMNMLVHRRAHLIRIRDSRKEQNHE